MGQQNGVAIGAASLAFGVVILALLWAFPQTLANEGSSARIMFAAIVLAAILAGSSLGFKSAVRVSTRQVFIWMGVMSVVFLSLTFQDDLTEIASAYSADLVKSDKLLPSTDKRKKEPGKVQLRAGRNGHFEVRALVNRAHINFLVDTGATHVALSPKDAQRIGIKLKDLKYNRPVSTANGVIHVAPIMIKQIKIGDIVVRNVSGAVIKEGLGDPLLGMSFLGKLSTFSMSREVLVMKQ